MFIDCPSRRAPVCGSNLKNYQNKCYLQLDSRTWSGLFMYYRGHCGDGGKCIQPFFQSCLVPTVPGNRIMRDPHWIGLSETNFLHCRAQNNKQGNLFHIAPLVLSLWLIKSSHLVRPRSISKWPLLPSGPYSCVCNLLAKFAIKIFLLLLKRF